MTMKITELIGRNLESKLSVFSTKIAGKSKMTTNGINISVRIVQLFACYNFSAALGHTAYVCTYIQTYVCLAKHKHTHTHALNY